MVDNELLKKPVGLKLKLIDCILAIVPDGIGGYVKKWQQNLMTVLADISKAEWGKSGQGEFPGNLKEITIK